MRPFTNEIIKAVQSERAYQEVKWSNPSSSVAEYLIYMRKHLNKALDAMATDECVGVCDTVLSEIRKVTALGFACGEEHGMPIRKGFEDAYLFVAGDLIYTEDEALYQCICSDANQAVFAKAYLDGEDVTVVYTENFVVFNFPHPEFLYRKANLNDLRRSIQDFAQNHMC